MGRNRERDQIQKILKCFIKSPSTEKTFDCLQKCGKNPGFLDILSKRISFVTLDTFMLEIERATTMLKYRRGSMKYKAVLDLKNRWRNEIGDIRKCLDCYEFRTMNETSEDFFTLVCSKPHLIVYVQRAETEGRRIWPAKILSSDDRNKTVTIEFFGEHLRADYAFRQCFLFSYEQENIRLMAFAKYAKDARTGKEEAYKRSFSEVIKYIENIKQKFHSFLPATTKVFLTDIEKHLKLTFPNYFPKITPNQIHLARRFAVMRITRPIEAKRKSVQFIEPIDQNLSVVSSNEIRVSLIDNGVGEVGENCSENNADSNGDLQIENGSSNGDQQTTDPTGDIHLRNGKRKIVDNTETREHPKRLMRTSSTTSDLIHLSEIDNGVVAIGDGDQDKIFSNPSSVNQSTTDAGDQSLQSDFLAVRTYSDNPDRSVGQPVSCSNANFVGNLDAFLDEFSEVQEKTSKYEELLEKLNEITLRNRVHDRNSHDNLNALLDEFGMIKVQVGNCLTQLERLNEYKAVIRTKIHNCKI